MTEHRDKTWIFQQAIRYRTLAPRRKAVSKQRRHLPLLPSVPWTRSDSKVKEGRAPPPRTAWNSRRPHSRVALTWGSRLSGYRAWAEPCTRQRVCPEERKMEASGDLDRSSQAPASAALSANMEIRQRAENRRSGWKCDWAFQKRLLKKRGATRRIWDWKRKWIWFGNPNRHHISKTSRPRIAEVHGLNWSKI